MLIAHVTYCYMPIIGGQEIYISQLIDLLKKNGIHSKVYQPIKRSYNYFSSKKDKNVRLVFSLPFVGRFFSGNISKFLFNLFLIFYVFEFRKYDKILIHYAYHSLPFFLFKKKVIVISHGVEWYLEKPKFNDMLSWFIAVSTKNIYKIVANDTHYLRLIGVDCSPQKQVFEEIEKDKWFIPNCVNTDKFINNFNDKSNLSTKIIFIPRQITYDRGIHLAIEAFAKLNKKVEGFILLIAGAIRNLEYKNYCDYLIERFLLNGKVIWNHKINNDNIISYYNNAIVTLIPSIRREGTSLSAIESMACGTPVVSTNVGGLADLPTVQAFANASDICDKLIYTINNYEEIRNFQYSKTIEVFNMRNWENSWLKVIKGI